MLKVHIIKALCSSKIMLYLFQLPNTALERDLKSIWSTWKEGGEMLFFMNRVF